MSDHTLARADEVLTELVELVETARTLPMSSSCVVPRERTLDLLDALREVLPPEMVEARKIVAERDRVLSEATTAATEREQTADEHAARARQSAADEVEAMLTSARVEVHTLLEAARAEQAELVAASSVHQTASAAAAELTASAQADAEAMTDQARAESSRLRADSQAYARASLTELLDHLARLTSTASNGLAALDRDADVEATPGSTGD